MTLRGGAVGGAKQRWSPMLVPLLFVPSVVATRCLPGDPASPVGVRSIADDVQDLTELEVLYMACAGERVEEISLELSPRPGRSAEDIAWRLRPEEQIAREDGLVSIIVPGFDDIEILGRLEPAAEAQAAVVVTTDQFEDGVLFDPPELDAELVTSMHGTMSLKEFEERYACEVNRS